MFVLFGWGHRTTKEYGPTVILKCPNCKNSAQWHLFSYKTWFTLFFIPVIPYESKHLLLCEICSHGFELWGDQINKAKELNSLTKAWKENKINDSEYVYVAKQKVPALLE